MLCRDFCNKSSEMISKNFKLPALLTNRSEMSNKALKDVRKNVDQTQEISREGINIKDSENLRKSKILSLPKGDGKNINIVPISESYYPYRRYSKVVHSDYRKNNVKKDSLQITKRQTEDKQIIVVSKAKIYLNLNANKFNERLEDQLLISRKISSHRRISTERMHNYAPISERKLLAQVVKTQQVQNKQSVSAFLIHSNVESKNSHKRDRLKDIVIERERERERERQGQRSEQKQRSIQQQIQTQQLEKSVVKILQKSHLKQKVKTEKQKGKNLDLTLRTLRGWTQYRNKSFFGNPQEDDVDKMC